jgi:4-amino-4-deoxy-L-arabinose transferase-like glycosyltransferase
VPLEKRWIFAAASAALLAAMGAAMLTAALEENDIYDEGGHLAAGWAYLTVQDFDFNAEHPPLGNLISALPLLWLNPRLPTEHPSWRTRAAPVAGALFLYRNRVRPAILLLAGRAATMLFAVLLGGVIAVWTRRRFGSGPALAALFLYATDPNFTAHGHYVTTDLFAAFFIFLAALMWDRHLRKGSGRTLVMAGLVFGMALAAKFSALALAPALVLLDWIERGRPELRRLAEYVALCSIAAFVVGLTYWSDTWKMITGDLSPLRHPYWMGLQYLAEHNRAGRPSYLLGMLSNHGWWYYFPVAFAVKTPTAPLLLALAAPLWGFARLARRWPVLVAPPAIYFALSLTSHLNLGIRHLLPVYPFLFVLLGAGLFELRRRMRVWALVLLSAVQVTEWVGAWPYFLAFFNSLAGGSSNGWRYLADSNLDWGQDVKRLKTYLDRLGASEACLAYFGTTDVAYYGIRRRTLPLTWEKEARERTDCVAAVSVNLLLGLYVKRGSYDWLGEREPLARVGYSIYVYDLRKGTP